MRLIQLSVLMYFIGLNSACGGTGHGLARFNVRSTALPPRDVNTAPTQSSASYKAFLKVLKEDTGPYAHSALAVAPWSPESARPSPIPVFGADAAVATSTPLWAGGVTLVAGPAAGAAKASDTANALVAVGKLVWEVVKDNRPTIVLASDRANVVPSGVEPIALDPSDKPPATLTFSYWSTAFNPNLNPPLVPVGHLRVTVTWSHSKTYKGSGKYITNAFVSADGWTILTANINITARFLDPERRPGDVSALPFTVEVNDKGNLITENTKYHGEIRGDGTSRIFSGKP